MENLYSEYAVATTLPNIKSAVNSLHNHVDEAVKISAHRRKDWIKSCLPQSVVRPQNHTNSNFSYKDRKSTNDSYITNMTRTYLLPTQIINYP